MRIEWPSATNVGYEVLGLTAALVALPRRVHDACPFRQFREHARAPLRDPFPAADHRHRDEEPRLRAHTARRNDTSAASTRRSR